MVNWETAFGVSDKVSPFLLTFALISQLQERIISDQTSECGLLGQKQGLSLTTVNAQEKRIAGPHPWQGYLY